MGRFGFWRCDGPTSVIERLAYLITRLTFVFPTIRAEKRVLIRAAIAVTLLGSSVSSGGQEASVRETIFNSYTPLASNAELARRLLTPLTFLAIDRKFAATHTAVRELAVSLADERFSIRIPTSKPSRGYGLLVFIPPWEDGRLPQGWARVLDRLGLIFVSPLRAGNEESATARREPLAILAAYNVLRAYAVDPERVFISGFSGGSRVAMRLAVAYPDLYRGALLDGGSDPIGRRETPLPPTALFDQFRRQSRIVYVTGALDAAPLEEEVASRVSMHKWCMLKIVSRRVDGGMHEVMPASALSNGIAALDTPSLPSSPSDACWQRVTAQLSARLDQAAALIKARRITAARTALNDIDATYGGLASPGILDLQRALDNSAATAASAIGH